MNNIADVARGKWRSILPALGIRSEFLTGKHGPCPMCEGKDRFRFTDHQQAGGYVCNACGNGDGIKLLMAFHGWTFVETADRVRPIVGEMPVDTRRRRTGDGRSASRAMWDSGQRICPNDEAADYLGSRRLTGPYPSDLRFLARCAVTGVDGTDSLPAMLALVRDADGGGALVHRTYLRGGAKAQIESPRRMMAGTLPPGGAIRLGSHNGVLGIAEGIETALAVTRDYGVPCWAASNANMLANFHCPPEVRELHIYGDNDPKFGGQSAAFHLGHRTSTRRDAPTVAIHIPPTVGEDWLDHGNALLERQHAA